MPKEKKHLIKRTNQRDRDKRKICFKRINRKEKEKPERYPQEQERLRNLVSVDDQRKSCLATYPK